MTSTNDGKDVKINQTSGQKGKTYYIELYKSLDALLNAEGALSERVAHLIAAWRRVHTLCLHSAPSTHPHLLNWIQRHTARIILQSEWQSPTSKEEQTKLEESINEFIQECQDAVTGRDGSVLPWESHLVARAQWFKGVLSNPWEHPVLKALLDPKGKTTTTTELLEWLKEERGLVFASRLRQLALSKCDDLALSLLTPVMDNVRASRVPMSDLELEEEEKKDTPEPKRTEPTFESILSTEAGFSDVWDLLTDMEYVLLFKSDRTRLIELVKAMPLGNGYPVVERQLNRLESTPREKRLWKNAKDVAALITQVMITRCMVIPVCSGVVRTVLYWCGRALVRAVPTERLPRASATLAAPATSARHLHTLASAVHAQQSLESEELKPFVVELYVRAITFGMNELEKLKLRPEYEEKEARATEQTLASWFIQLGQLLSQSARMKCECTLTAFSVHPSPVMYDRIKNAPPLPAVSVEATQTKQEPETKSEFGSWANDSRSQTNFVKTSEHLKMQQTQHQANVLSTAILNEGETLGLDAELCQDIIVLLSGPRVKTLSWDVDRKVLLSNCRAYMERTQSGTRALTTELKYLNLDPAHYQHLPEDRDHDDEDDLYYGIEKGYEHHVELEPQPEEIWEDAYYDFERTDSAFSGDDEVPIRRKKKNKQPSSDSDSDPLSLVAEKKEKKKERPHSKERSKERKKTKDADKSKDVKDKDKEHAERRKDERKDKKKEKKERKKREKKKAKNPLVEVKTVRLSREEAASQNICTDSENDSQSRMSLLPEGADENIVYDGQFSMDELKSPERPNEDANKNAKSPQNNLLIAGRQKTSAAIQNAKMTYLKHMAPLNVGQQMPPMSIASSSTSLIREEVKKSITKLIQFRRQKTSEASSNSPMSSPSHTDSPVGTPGSPHPKSPLFGTKGSNTNVIFNKKQQVQQNTIKNEVKEYKAIYYPPGELETVSTCSRVQPFNPMYAKRAPHYNQKTDNLSSHMNEALNLTQQKPLNNTHNNQSKSPRISDSTHLSSYQKFLQDLQRNANAGLEEPEPKKKEIKPISKVTPVIPHTFNNESSVTTPPNVVKTENRMNCNIPNIKTEPRVTPATHTVVKQEPIISPQCAKLVVQPKKVENAPNTFARRSYMHKNKLKYDNDKYKQLDSTAAALESSISEELDRRIAELKVIKMKKFLKDNESTVSRAISTTSVKPKEPLNVEEKKTVNTATANTLNQRHPLLSNILKNAAISVKSSHGAQNATTKPRILVKSKNTALTEKDQQDLLKLLGQQNLMNRPQPKINTQPNTVVNSPYSANNSSNIESNKSSAEGIALQVNRSAKPKPMPVQEQIAAIEHKGRSQLDGSNFNFPVISNSTIMRTTAMVQNKVQTSSNRKPKQKAAKQETIKPNNTDLEVNKEVSKKYVPKPPVNISKFDADTVEQDWTKVLDAIRAQKTPSRGINALDMALKKDSFEKVNESNQPIISLSPVTKANNTLKHTTPTSTQINQSVQPVESSKPSISVAPGHHQNWSVLKNNAVELPKKQNETVAEKNVPPNPVILYPEVTKPSLQHVLPKENDPFISGIPNADYEILEELMDDDLRQEIGELSSDEESYRASTEPPKDLKNIECKNVTMTKKVSVKKQDPVSWNNPSEITTPTPKELPQNVKAKPQIISNEKVDILKLHQNLIGSKIIRQEPTTMASKLQSKLIYNVNNTIATTTITSTTTTSTLIFNAAPQPSGQNMVIVDPYGVASNLNKNYVAVSNVQCTPNVVYKKFSGPAAAASQIIFGTNYITAPTPTPVSVVFDNSKQIISSNVPIMHISEATPMPKIPVQTNNTITNKPFDSTNVKQLELVKIRKTKKPKAVPIKIQQDTVDSKPTDKVSMNTQQTTVDHKLANKAIIKIQRSTIDHKPINKVSINIQQGPDELKLNNKLPIHVQQSTADSNVATKPTDKVSMNTQQTTVDHKLANKAIIKIQRSTIDHKPTNKVPINIQQGPDELKLNNKLPIHVQQSTADSNVANKGSINMQKSTVDSKLIKKVDTNIQCNAAAPKQTNKTPVHIQQIDDPKLSGKVSMNIQQNTADSKLTANKVEMTSIKTSERKVLSEVQEKLTKFKAETKVLEKIDPVNIKNQRLSFEAEKKKEVCENRERLIKKRIALMHRTTNNRSFHPAIPLPYVPLISIQSVEHENILTNEIVDVPKHEDKKEDKSDSTTAVSENATNQTTLNSASNSKDNEVSESYRRILLRSSNKGEILAVPTNNEKTTSRKTKVKLKDGLVATTPQIPKENNVSAVTKTTLNDANPDTTKNNNETNKHSATEVAENLEGKVKAFTEKASLPIRVSKRILNKKIKKTKEKEINNKTKKKAESKVIESKVIDTNSENEKLIPLTKQDNVDIEDAIVGNVIPKNSESPIKEDSSLKTKLLLKMPAKESDNLLDTKEVPNEIVDISSSPEICKCNPLDAEKKSVEGIEKQNDANKIDPAVKGETKSVTIPASKNEETRAHEKITQKKLGNKSGYESKLAAVKNISLPVEMGCAISNQMSKLVDEIESVICAITQSTICSPPVEKEFDEIEPIKQHTDVKETDVLQISLPVSSGNQNTIRPNTTAAQYNKSDKNKVPIGTETSKKPTKKSDKQQTNKIHKDANLIKGNTPFNKDSKTSNKNIVAEKIPAHEGLKVDKIRLKIKNPKETSNTPVYEIDKTEVPKVKPVNEKSVDALIKEKESSAKKRPSMTLTLDKAEPKKIKEGTDNVCKDQKNQSPVDQCGLKTKDTAVINQGSKEKTDVKLTEKSMPGKKEDNVKVSQKVNESANSKHLQNNTSTINSLNEKQFHKSVIENKNKDANSLSSATDLDKVTSNKDSLLTEDKSKNNDNTVPQSYKDSIKIKEIPLLGNTNPLKRCVRIVLPNNKVFKATVHGKVNVSFDTLFEEPALKKILLSSMNERKRYLLNIQQLSTSDHKIVNTKIQGIDVRENKPPIQTTEVVNLISDDEDEPCQTITTVCGSFKVKNIDRDILKKHEEKLLQRCTIKLERCDVKLKTDVLVQALLEDMAIAMPSEVIEIDDSSSDGESSQGQTGIDVLKDMLLKDLGVVNLIRNNTADGQQDVNKTSNERPSRNRKSKYHREKDSKTVSMESDIRSSSRPKESEINNTSRERDISQNSHKHPKQNNNSKIVTRDCYIKLINCDNLVKEMCGEVGARENVAKLDDEMITFVGDEDIPVLSRSGSFSILNELDSLDEPIAPRDGRDSPVIPVFETINALRDSYSCGRHSPVMEAYDMIAALQNKPRTIKTLGMIYKSEDNFLCISDWFETKRNLHTRDLSLKARTIDDIFQEIVNSKLESFTDCETDVATTMSIADSENFHTETFTVPSLTSIMSKYFEDNPLVYQLKPHVNINELPKTQLKRKRQEPIKIASNKVTKMSTRSEIQKTDVVEKHDLIQTLTKKIHYDRQVAAFVPDKDASNVIGQEEIIHLLPNDLTPKPPFAVEESDKVIALKNDFVVSTEDKSTEIISECKNTAENTKENNSDDLSLLTAIIPEESTHDHGSDISSNKPELEMENENATDSTMSSSTAKVVDIDFNVNNYKVNTDLTVVSPGSDKQLYEIPVSKEDQSMNGVNIELGKPAIILETAAQKIQHVIEDAIKPRDSVELPEKTNASTKVTEVTVQASEKTSIIDPSAATNTDQNVNIDTIEIKDSPETILPPAVVTDTLATNTDPYATDVSVAQKNPAAKATDTSSVTADLEPIKITEIKDILMAPVDSANVSVTNKESTNVSDVITSMSPCSVVEDTHATNVDHKIIGFAIDTEDSVVITENVEISMTVSEETTLKSPVAVGEDAVAVNANQDQEDVSIAPKDSAVVFTTVEITTTSHEIKPTSPNVSMEYRLAEDPDNDISENSVTTHVSEKTVMSTVITNETKSITPQDALETDADKDSSDDSTVLKDFAVDSEIAIISTTDPKEMLSTSPIVAIKTVEDTAENISSSSVVSPVFDEISTTTEISTIPDAASTKLLHAIDENISAINAYQEDTCDILISPKDSAVVSETTLICTTDLEEISLTSPIVVIETAEDTDQNISNSSYVSEVSETTIIPTVLDTTTPKSPLAIDGNVSAISADLEDTSQISVAPENSAVISETCVVKETPAVNLDQDINDNAKITRVALVTENNETTISDITSPKVIVEGALGTNADEDLIGDFNAKTDSVEFHIISKEKIPASEIVLVEDTILTNVDHLEIDNSSALENSITIVEEIIDNLPVQETEELNRDIYQNSSDAESTFVNDPVENTAYKTIEEAQYGDNNITTPEEYSMASETSMENISTSIIEDKKEYSSNIIIESEECIQKTVSVKSTSILVEETAAVPENEPVLATQNFNKNSETTMTQSKKSEIHDHGQITQDNTEYQSKLNTETTTFKEGEATRTIQNNDINVRRLQDDIQPEIIEKVEEETDVKENNNINDSPKDIPSTQAIKDIASSVSPQSITTSEYTIKAVDMDDNYVYETEIVVEVQDETNESDKSTKLPPTPNQIQLAKLEVDEKCSSETTSECMDDEEIIVEKTIKEVDCDENVFGKNATLVYKDDSGVILKGIEYEDPEMGTCYVFPLVKSSDESGTTEVLNSSAGSTIEVIQEIEISTEIEDSELNTDLYYEQDLKLIIPKYTYLKRSLKRKSNMKDVTCSNKRSRRNSRCRESTEMKITEKKYRKGKNIDAPKLSASAIVESGNIKDFKRRLDYYSTVGFSYSVTFSTEFIDVPKLLNKWPISGPITTKAQYEPDTEHALFVDLDNIENQIRDPLQQTLVEEITANYNEADYPNWNAKETNFNMGFGEGSGRVIQNLDGGTISNFSAATLSDVKHTQPCLLSEKCAGSAKKLNFLKSSEQDQLRTIKRHLSYMKLKEKVRSFFKNSTYELTRELEENLKDSTENYDASSFPFELFNSKCMEPLPIETVVQVVQVGQLPVSAAAQNPVTCDPRVTQVSDASPSQCSVENSPHDDSQPEIKTEYTELTTADLNLPLADDYARHNQSLPMGSQNTAMSMNSENIPIETELVKSEVKIEIVEEPTEEKDNNELCEGNHHINNDYLYNTNNTNPSGESQFQALYDSNKQESSETTGQQKPQNGSSEKTDQIAHAMNAAGIITNVETANSRAQAIVNMLAQKLRQGALATTPNSANNYPKTTSINAMSLQQALASILPPPLNQTNSAENNQQGQNTVTPQVLHIVQGKNASGNQITLVDNSQQSVITNPNATPVLHIVQNKATTPTQIPNNSSAPQSNTFSGLSLVDTGLQQGGNQLLHIVNTGNQKNNNAGQLLKRVNLLTNLTNVQGSNEQKMLQFVCKSADGKPIQLNHPHQRSMVLRLQPIESANVHQATPKPPETNQDLSPSQNTTNSAANNKDSAPTQQEIKSRSVYEENYAKFIQNSANKPTIVEKANSLPKFNQAFGKAVFQDGNQKQNEMNSNSLPPVTANTESSDCQATDNGINIDHLRQIGSPPLLLRKPPTQTTQAQQNLVQQIKQTIAPMNLQTMHGGVIYTRQIPVNIGGGQTINLITVPSTELIDESAQKQQTNQGDTIEPSIIKIVPQSQPPSNAEVSDDMNNDNAQQSAPQPQPVLTQMRIKLPMLSKTPQMVSGTRVVRPSFFQIQRNVIGGGNQAVYQQLVLTAAPPLGQQTIRLPQAQTRQIKVPENQSSSESQMSSSTLEQLREFDMVLEQVKERSTVQPNSNSGSNFKLHTPSTDTTDSPATATTTETTQVLYSIGNSQPLSVTYVNRKPSGSTSTSTTYVRSPDSSAADSPTSSSHSHIPHASTSEASSNETTTHHHKPVKVSSKSKSRPKSSSHAPNSMKLHNVPPKTSTQKPLEDEQTTQRILYILAEYKEQVENSPDKDKPAPRRRSNPPSNPPGSSKRKKSSSGSRRSGRDISPIHGDDTCRTMGSEDSSCGTSQGDCTESCMDSHSPQDSPRKVARKLAFDPDPPTPPTQTRPPPQRNVIVADGQTITVARGTAGKPTTTVLMPTNYILPVSMVKGGQQIAIVTNRGPKLLTVGGGEGGATNALLLQRLIGPAGLKPVLTRPGVRHVRLPTAALHNLQAFNLATATSVQPNDSAASSAAESASDLMDTNRSVHSPWTDRETDIKPDRASTPDESEPWHLPTAADPHDYGYEETVRSENMDRTVLDPIQDRYSPDMEAQRIFDKMFDVDTKKSYIVDSPRCGYDIDASDCDDKPYQVVHKKDGTHRQTRLSHVSAAALRHKYAILEHELRLQKSLSEECEDLGVDSPSASELFPEAELLFAASPAQDHGPDTPQHSHTPQPTLLNQSAIQPDIDDQIATDQLLPRHNIPDDRQDLGLGLEDVGIVTVSEDGMQATIALDQEEFARSHPNTTFHSEPTDEGEVQPFTISGLKGRHITSTIFHSNRAPATVLMTAPQSTVISQATAEAAQNPVKYADINNMIHAIPSTHTNNINLSSVLVKDDGLTRFDNILTDSRELHLSNTASAIVHSASNTTQVIRRVCYDDNKRERESFLMDEPDALIAGDDAKMVAEDSSRDATLESMTGDVDDDNSSPERHAELFWESNSASERSESRRPLEFSSDSEKCCKSPSYDETNSTDSSGVGTHMRLDSVIKEARGVDRSGSADGSSADDTHPPLRTYPPKRLYHTVEGEMERSLSGKTRAGERSPDLEVRRRASGRGVVKRGCHCCNGSPAPQRPKKPRQRKPTIDFTT